MANESIQQREIKWESPEFEYHKKGISWYCAVIIIAGVIMAFALWQKNFLFAVFVVIATIMVIFLGKQKPRMLKFKIDRHRLEIDKIKFYSFESFLGFSIPEIDQEWPQLALRRKGRLSPYLKISIHREDIEKIRIFLIQFLPEIEYEESLSEAISKFLRF